MNSSRLKLCFISLFVTLTIANVVHTTSSSSLPLNKLVQDALRRHQREAMAESSSNDEDSENDSSSATTTEASSSSSSSASSTEKPKSNSTRIDWDEIERTWYEWKEDAEVTKKWQDMESGMKKGVKSVLRTIFPRIVAMSSDTKVSGNCSAGILKWLISLRSLKDWSIRMLDAIGKPSSGLLEGQVSMFGNYHECTKIRVFEDDEEDFEDEEDEKLEAEKVEPKEFFRGKYCILEFKPWLPKKPPFYGMNTKLKALARPPKDDTVLRDIADLAVFLNFVSFRLDLCIPSLCSKNDIQKVVGLISRLIDIRGKVVRCEVDEEPTSQVSNPQVAALMVMNVVCFIFAILTVLSFCGMFREDNSLSRYLKSLTWTTSLKELVSDDSYRNKKHISAVYGLRTILMMYIILVHTAIEVNFQFFRDVLWIRDVALSFLAQPLTKSSYNFDMFIMISAFTMAYTVGSRGGSRALKFLFKKYLRVTPVIMFATCWLMILPLAKKVFRGGPTWGDFVPKPAKACEQNGLLNLLYVQNFWKPTEMCLKNTWLFSVEMQLYLAFVPFMMIARKASKSTVILLSGLIVIIGFICNVLTVYKYELPPHLIWTLPDPDQRNFYYQVHYFKPWTHLSVFAIGIAAGWLCANRSRKPFSNSSTPYGLGFSGFMAWSISFAVILALLFTHHDWVLGKLPEPLIAGIFEGSHRILVSLATAYMVYSLTVSCEENRSSLVARILGGKFMTTLGRLTLVAYTIHPIIQLIFLGTQSAQLFSGPIVALYVVCGNIMLTYVHSFVISVIYEIPITSGLKARHPTSTLKLNNGDSSNASGGKEFPRSLTNNNKSNSLSVVSCVNGDIEMSKHVERL